jgi:hypothetical protein
MNFLHYEFPANTGNRVEVILHGSAANVMLLDDSNFNNYKASQPFRYYGGHYTMSPILIAVPYAGHWNLVVDLGGAPGHVDASVRLI